MTTSSLYCHVPFCVAKCPYCAFASAPKQASDEAVYLEALEREFKNRSHCCTTIDTLYIGGGTPTSLSANGWLELIDLIERNTRISSTAEITVEANPGTLTKEQIDIWRCWRVTRVSIGVQSLDDAELALLGRPHTAALAADAVASAKMAGFSVSVDLIFALPGATFQSWGRTIKEALALRPHHISLYQLTFEPGTPFESRKTELPPCGDGYAEYRYAQWRLPKSGYEQYEVASFALPGHRSRHNTNYWRDGQYLGVGPSAWSYLDSARTQNERQLAQYAEMLACREDAIIYSETLTGERAARQAAVLALRTSDGIVWPEFRQKFGTDAAGIIRGELCRYPHDLVCCDDDRSRLTTKGLRIGNLIWSELI